MRLSDPASLCSPLLFAPALSSRKRVSDYKSNPKFQTAISEAKQLSENQIYATPSLPTRSQRDRRRQRHRQPERALSTLQLSIGDYDDAIATAHTFEPSPQLAA